jgi:glycine cleavage system H lipoate-binding protein
LNSVPHTDGWIARIKLAAPGEIAQLLSAADYRAYITAE